MSTQALSIVNGMLRMVTILPSIYDQSISIVASGATPPSSLNGPISSGTAITLPGSQTYTVSNSVPNATIFVNGQRLEYVFDWATSGTGPNFSAFTLTIGLIAGDRIDIRIERNS